MPFHLPQPPVALHLTLSERVRRWPLSRYRLQSSDVVISFVFFAVVGATGCGVSIFAPRGSAIRELLLVPVIGIWALWICTAALLLYRWMVVCPVCQNGYFPGHPADWHCDHCGLDIAADDDLNETNPWGSRGEPPVT